MDVQLEARVCTKCRRLPREPGQRWCRECKRDYGRALRNEARQRRANEAKRLAQLKSRVLVVAQAIRNVRADSSPRTASVHTLASTPLWELHELARRAGIEFSDEERRLFI